MCLKGGVKHTIIVVNKLDINKRTLCVFGDNNFGQCCAKVDEFRNIYSPIKVNFDD